MIFTGKAKRINRWVLFLNQSMNIRIAVVDKFLKFRRILYASTFGTLSCTESWILFGWTVFLVLFKCFMYWWFCKDDYLLYEGIEIIYIMVICLEGIEVYLMTVIKTEYTGCPRKDLPKVFSNVSAISHDCIHNCSVNCRCSYKVFLYADGFS